MIQRQFTLFMESKRGALARVAESLAKAKVNIEGISVAESEDTALMQVIVDRPEAAQRALKAEGISFEAQDVAVVLLPHRPGALAALAAHLAKAGVNINYLYATVAEDEPHCCVVLSADDLAKAEKAAAALCKK